MSRRDFHPPDNSVMTEAATLRMTHLRMIDAH
jgi:hypothetical protein